MSSGNFDQEKKRNFQLRKKRVSADYTIKTGRSDDTGVIDNPVAVYNPAADVAITLPDGTYIGQEVMVVVESNSETKDATLTVSTPASGSEDVSVLEDAGEYITYLWTGVAWDYQNHEGCDLS